MQRQTTLPEERCSDAKQRRARSASQADAIVSTAPFMPFETPRYTLSLSHQVVVEKLVILGSAKGNVAAAKLLNKTPQRVVLALLQPRVADHVEVMTLSFREPRVQAQGVSLAEWTTFPAGSFFPNLCWGFFPSQRRPSAAGRCKAQGDTF